VSSTEGKIPKHSGTLTLSWTNKHLRLLSHEGGTYEWVDPKDFRVSEVRLLQDEKSVGTVHAEKNRAKDNLLIRGDSLHALTSLLRIPEFAEEYEGKVKLVYIDPPFNTGQAFTHYDDGLEHSVWLTMLRDRLVQIRKLLSDDGSVWVHLDDYEVHRARVVIDEIFGSQNFVASIVWRSADTGNYDAKQFSVDHNTILVYSRNAGWRANPVVRTEAQSSHYANPDNDPRGPWFDGNPLGSPNPRENLRYNIESPTGHLIKHPPNGWRWSRETLDKKLGTGEVRFSPDGKRIILRTYLWEQKDLPPSTLWDDTSITGSNRKAKNELKKLFNLQAKQVFDTPKPESLMRRILEIATNPGDVVLDCFAGSGTTAAVAHKMGRRWATVEWSAENLANFTLPRLEKVVNGSDQGGISEVINWNGGDGFRVMDIAPSVYEIYGNSVLLSESVTAGELAESVAAQLGFDYEPDGVFAATKGRMRLAVIDGVFNNDIARMLTSLLKEKERVTVVATAAEPGSEDLLLGLSSGSKLRKVPRDLAKLSAKRSQVVQLVLEGLEG
jgi:adenine-specific DNA-methyltransferase